MSLSLVLEAVVGRRQPQAEERDVPADGQDWSPAAWCRPSPPRDLQAAHFDVPSPTHHVVAEEVPPRLKAA